MFKLLAFILVILCSNFTKTSEITNEQEGDVRTVGVKREFAAEEATDTEDPKPKVIKKEEVSVYDSLERFITNLNAKKSQNYEEEPNLRFLDELVRRSFDLKRPEGDSDDSFIWEMPLTLSMSADWHTEAFFLVLKANCGFSEEVLTEYFRFLMPGWGLKPFIANKLCLVLKYSIDQLFLDLFEQVLMVLDVEMDALIGKKILFALLKREGIKTPRETALWQMMCTKAVKKIPKAVYESDLRIGDFKGETRMKQPVFIHLLPILRTLMMEIREELEAEIDAFEHFIIVYLGDMEEKLPMGTGGLKIINQMFLRSRISTSAFKSPEFIQLKRDIVEKMIEELFLDIGVVELCKMLFDNLAFSIFEAFLKYSKLAVFNDHEFIDILSHFITKSAYYNELNFIAALVAYSKVPNSVWDLLKGSFHDQKSAIINEYEAFSEALEGYSTLNLDLKLNDAFEFKIDSAVIDGIAEMKRIPIQMEVGRIFLARSCGIPLQMTEVTEFCGENFEWSEIVGFINFHVERTAGIVGYSGEVMKFTCGM